MKRLTLVLILLVMLPVLAPASNAPTANVHIEETAETAKGSSNSTITITMTGVDD